MTYTETDCISRLPMFRGNLVAKTTFRVTRSEDDPQNSVRVKVRLITSGSRKNIWDPIITAVTRFCASVCIVYMKSRHLRKKNRPSKSEMDSGSAVVRFTDCENYARNQLELLPVGRPLGVR